MYAHIHTHVRTHSQTHTGTHTNTHIHRLLHLIVYKNTGPHLSKEGVEGYWGYNTSNSLQLKRCSRIKVYCIREGKKLSLQESITKEANENNYKYQKGDTEHRSFKGRAKTRSRRTSAHSCQMIAGLGGQPAALGSGWLTGTTKTTQTRTWHRLDTDNGSSHL